MAVQWKTGSFSLLTSDTTTKAVTGVGFQPQGYALFSINATNATGTSTTHSCVGEGLTDGTRQYAQCVASGDGLVTTSVNRAAQSTRVLHLVSYAGTTQSSASHLSLDSDGFTLTINTTAVANLTVFYVAWAGMTSQYLDVFTLPTATGSFSRTSAGFQADAIFWLSNGTVTLGNTAAGIHSLGWSLASGTQFAMGSRHGNSLTTNYSSSTFATDRVIINYDTSGASNTPDVSLTSHDATGFTANRLTGTTAQYVAAMHFKGGVWAIGTTTAASGTGTTNLTTTGLTPGMLMLLASNHTTASRTTPFEESMYSYGVATGASARFALGATTFNNETLNPNVTEEYTRTDTSKLWIHYDRTGANTYTATGEIDISSFQGSSATINQTDGDPTAILIGWVANGESFTALGGSPGLTGGFMSLSGGLA